MALAQRLAERLKELRREAGLNQSEMARALGLSQPTLNRLESATQNTTLATLDTVCRSLHCDVASLFTGPLPESAMRRLRRRRR